MQCATHPNVETNLACGRCGKAICPQCLVYAPVGVRCRECGKGVRLPTYRLDPQHLLMASAVGLGLGAGLGALWAVLLRGSFGLSFFSLLLAVGIGWGIAEAISRSVNKKRGPPLQVIAGASVVVSYVARSVMVAALYNYTFVDAFLSIAIAGAALALVIAVSMLK